MADEAPLSPGLTWLYGTQVYGIKLGLDGVRRVLAELELPSPGMKFLHVAGTNGKGSTCALLHAVLSAAGFRVGLFTSPHLIRFNERIRDHERAITDDEIEAGLTRLRERVADWQPAPTFFELTLALALDWFRARHCEWVILETGLGGRLDATNALLPEACAITRIGMDHMAQLGDTLAAIAAEKAGILKPGVPAVTGPQEPEALAVLRATARERALSLTVVEQPLDGLPLGLAGPHQRWNAAVAVALLEVAGFDLPPAVIEAGLRDAVWPARFQRLEEGRLILDGAHNPDAAQALVAAWQEAFPGESAVIVFGGSSGKDHSETLRPLLPLGARWIFTAFDSPRAVPPAEILEAYRAAGGDPQLCQTADSLPAALALARSHGARLLVTGSLFLAGEFLALQERSAHQPSVQ
jgi:dihydrofolate synthase/folylpolyglutamate synthase